MKRLLLAVAILLSSCAEPAIKGGDIASLFTKERRVAPSAEIVISEPLGGCSLVDIIDGFALLQTHTQSADYNFCVVDTKTGEVVNKLFSRGRGRNELMYPEYISSSDKNIYLYDQMKPAVISFLRDDILTKSVDIETTTIKYQNLDMTEGYIHQSFANIGNDRFVVSRHRAEDDMRHLMMIPIEDNQFQDGEIFSRFGEDDDSDKITSLTYKGKIATSEQGDAMLYCVSLGVYMRFYDCSDNSASPTLVKEYNVQLPEYEMEVLNFPDGGRGVSYHPSDDIIKGISAIAANDDNFYLVYCGLSTSQIRALSQEECAQLQDYPTILVFNKRGEPQEKIIVEGEVDYDFKYNAKTDSFYALIVNDDGDDCFVEYKL